MSDYERDYEDNLDDELRYHLEQQIQQHVARGIDPAEARRLALIALDGVEACKEKCRDRRKGRLLEDLGKDLAGAVRSLRRSPGFALLAAGTLAIGIGAATAIFSVTDGVLLKPLPYPGADRLVLAGDFSSADFVDYRAGTTAVFEEIAGVTVMRTFVSREDGSAEQLSRGLVTPNLLRFLGASIAVGRDFNEADALRQPEDGSALMPPGSAAILSYEYWQRRYGGDVAVIGREIGHGPRIVGVLAPGFRLVYTPLTNTDTAPDFWVAGNIGYDNKHRNLLAYASIARLRPGVSLAAAQARVDALTSTLKRTLPTFDRKFRLEPLHRRMVGEVRTALLALMGSVIFLLLIACANVANLLLVRASLRERELAVRATMGAPRWRLMRQMLLESLVLAALGVAGGIGLARIGIRELLAIAPANLPRMVDIAIDWPVLAFAALAGIAATALFGLLPSWRASCPDVAQVLRSASRGLTLGGASLRSAVVILQAALAFVLLVGCGLMLRSFVALNRIDPGYDPRGILTVLITREWPLARQDGRLELLREIQDRLRALPGVESVSATIALPLAHGPHPLSLAPRVQPAVPTADAANFEQVLPGYFETLRTPLLAGRSFTDADNVAGRRVAVIDDLLAEHQFGRESPIGKRLLVPWPDMPWVEVIGVVKHQRAITMADVGPEDVYFTDGLAGVGVSRQWAIRTAGDPTALASAVRAEIAKIDRQLVVVKVQPMQALVERDQSKTRFALVLMAAFGAAAMLLAAVGLYGVLASAVRQRTSEIGVRMALGAQPSGIFALIAGQGLRLAAFGIAIGALASLALTRAINALLVGVRPTDPLTLASVAAVFLLIAGAASWLPARRAASLDPNAALRQE